jgi:murein L,D-transpeptidase YcbB/YkuD
VASAAQGPDLADPQAEQLDAALTAALHRYLADLRTGRIDPRQIRAEFTALPARDFDPAAYLKAALAAPHFADALRAAAPRAAVCQPARLLAHYRTLADHPAWATPRRHLASASSNPASLGGLPPHPATRGTGRPAGRHAAHTHLRHRAEGVRAFQQRHALAADGVMGRGTLAHGGGARPARGRSRWPWNACAGHLQLAPRMIVVNVPEFVLRAYEVRDGTVSVALTMKVIVGKA